MIESLTHSADALLIVPPFSQVSIQSLAVHTLQACAVKEGFSVRVFYAGMHLASRLGPLYTDICQMNYFLLGERLFARAAWGKQVARQTYDDLYAYEDLYGKPIDPLVFFPPSARPDRETLVRAEQECFDWVESLAGEFDHLPFAVVGATSSFEQTNAAMAILRRIKERNPRIITQIGGFNCEQDCAEGIASLDPDRKFLDYIFSGEGEHLFIEFLKGHKKGILPKERILTGEPLIDLDEIPPLDYSDYFRQLDLYLPELAAEKGELNIAFETSRGCWWGEKNQCRFCGFDKRLCFREKTPERFLRELDLMKKWGVPSAHMADLIMPFHFFKTLLPELAAKNDYWTFYYEQKVSLNRQELSLLRKAGITEIQPGIESLSGKLLQHMGKGTSLKKNLRFLRDAYAEELTPFWNIVWGLPGEENREYRKMNDLLPLIRHLPPPIGIFYLSLVKFSPYFRNPERYGLRDIRPNPSYGKVFPEGTDLEKIAIVFLCRYEAETKKDSSQVDSLVRQIEEWHERWNSFSSRPRLMLYRQDDGSIVLLDTRGLDGTSVTTELNDEQIRVLSDWELYEGLPEQDWALQRNAAVLAGKELISLAVIDSPLKQELDEEKK
jgi:ribosomal peptide maturation radical SAM protein 1